MANYIQPNTGAPVLPGNVGGVPVVNGNPLQVTVIPIFIENVSDADDPANVIRVKPVVHKGSNNR
jgi:hypothetical protein